ncbi:MAG: Ig-like domain-containing protein [Spirochaetales bacterium]|nr:Ig-like domain-containing protein [Spirochaetales bacterium]
MKRFVSLLAALSFLFLVAACQQPTDPTTPGTIDIEVTGLELANRGNITVETDEAPTLAVAITPSDANTGISWSSSDNSVLTVSSSGQISPVALGTAVVTVSSTIDPSISSSCTVTIIADGTRADMSDFVLINQNASPLDGTTTAVPEFINGKLILQNSDGAAKVTSAGLEEVTFLYFNEALNGDFLIRARVLVSNPVAVSTSKGAMLGAFTLADAHTLEKTAYFSSMQIRSGNGGDRNGYSTKDKSGALDTGTSSPKESGADVPLSVERIYEIKRDATGITLSVFASDEEFDGTEVPVDSELLGYSTGSESTLLYNAITSTTPMYGAIAVYGATVEISNLTIESAGTEIYSSSPVNARPVMVASVSINSDSFLRNPVSDGNGGYSLHYQNTLSGAQADSIDLDASVIPTFSGDLTVSWSSSDDSVVTVDGDGVLTFHGAGSASVTATANDGTGFLDRYYVGITSDAVPVTGIAVSGESTVMKNLSTGLSAIVSPANATDQTVSWSSDDETIAIVDAAGNVTGKAVGTTVIRAVANDGSGVSAPFDIEVIASAGELVWNFQTYPTDPETWLDDTYYGDSNSNVTTDISYLNGIVFNTSDEKMKFRAVEADRQPPSGTDGWSWAYLATGGSGDHITISDISGSFTVSMHYETNSSSGYTAATVKIDDALVGTGAQSVTYGDAVEYVYTHTDTGSPVTLTIGCENKGIRLYDLVLTLASAQP